MLIGIVTSRRQVYERYLRNKSIKREDTVFVSSIQQAIGLYFDEIIFTCGYGNINARELLEITLRINPDGKSKYDSCCGSLVPIIK